MSEATLEELRAQMLRADTPVEDHIEEFGLLVKREDLSCLPPGPPFSKTRGVFAHIAALDAQFIGVLDTYHSQAGHAVARACQILGRGCLNYYPEYKHEPGHREPQQRAKDLGASLFGLPAGRSAVIYHQAKKHLRSIYRKHPDGSGKMVPINSYMMPNALKLPETVSETAKEVTEPCWGVDTVIVPISSGTIAAGVIRGYLDNAPGRVPLFILHMGYDRSESAVMKYLEGKVGPDFPGDRVCLIKEGYGYKDQARPGDTPPWPSNAYYDLKAFRWCQVNRNGTWGRTLFWNVG